MKRILLTALMLLALMSGKLRAQVTFDIVSVEAYSHETHTTDRPEAARAACCLPAARWSTATNCCMNTAVKKWAATRS